MEIPFNHLRDLREDRELSQADVAAVLGVAQNTYSQYETGKIDLTAPVLILLSDFYAVSIDYLLDRTDEPRLYPKRKSKSP